MRLLSRTIEQNACGDSPLGDHSVQTLFLPNDAKVHPFALVAGVRRSAVRRAAAASPHADLRVCGCFDWRVECELGRSPLPKPAGEGAGIVGGVFGAGSGNGGRE